MENEIHKSETPLIHNFEEIPINSGQETSAAISPEQPDIPASEVACAPSSASPAPSQNPVPAEMPVPEKPLPETPATGPRIPQPPVHPMTKAARKRQLRHKIAATKEQLIRQWIERMRPGIEDLYAGKADFFDRMALRFLYRMAKAPAPYPEISLPAEPLLTAFCEKTHPAFTEEGFIRNQRLLRGVPFGDKGNTADYGCGWVSYYNVRLLTGNPVEPLEALRAVRNGQRKGGLRGTDPFYIIKLLRSEGYYAEFFFKQAELDRVAKAADAFISLYLYQRRDRLFGHFVAGKYDWETDAFITYNGEGGTVARVNSVDDIPCRKAFFRMIIAVSRKEQ